MDSGTFDLVYLPPNIPTIATLASAPAGRAGVFHTLRTMRLLVDEWKTRMEMINAAVSLIFLVPEKDEMSEIQALFNFVRDGIRYTRDVHGVETLSNPMITMQRKVGDCDDKATLFATLAEAVGFPTRFVMAGYFGSPDFEHVYAQVLTEQGWLDADPTEPYPLGYAPAAPTKIFIERV